MRQGEHWVQQHGFPSAKAEPSKLRFERPLEYRPVVGCMCFDVRRSVILRWQLWEWGIPSFAKEGIPLSSTDALARTQQRQRL